MSSLHRTASNGSTAHQNRRIPLGLSWRSSKLFILTTVGIGMFTDLFLYNLITPVFPFLLRDRLGIPRSEIQSTVSNLLAIYAACSLVFSPIAGVIADKTSTRQIPFLGGLISLFIGTSLLAVAPTIPFVILARVLQGLSAAVVWTLGLAMCLETVGPKNLGTTIGTVSERRIS